MNIELLPHLEAIASIMKMTKINDRQYKGEHGQLFRKTNFGYIPESHFNRDLEGKEKFQSHRYPSKPFFTPISDIDLGIYPRV